jgi:hypothetical protein
MMRISRLTQPRTRDGEAADHGKQHVVCGAVLSITGM